MRYLNTCNGDAQVAATTLKAFIDRTRKNKKKTHKNFVSFETLLTFQACINLIAFRSGKIC